MKADKWVVRAVVVLMTVLVLVLGTATIIEEGRGTAFVSRNIYGTPWFCMLWGAIAFLGCVAMARRRLWRRMPILLLHASLLVILAGALVTRLTSVTGMLHLRPDSPGQNTMLTEDGGLHRLPFTIALDTFYIEHYPGTDAPSDYVSRVRVDAQPEEHVISMNNILEVQGYRLYQSSYDDDRLGTWLTVYHDPWGIAVTYTGYVLLGLSMLWVLLSRKEEFRRLLRHPSLRRSMLVLSLMVVPLVGLAQAHGDSRTLPVLKRAQADSLARVQVLYQDRIVPFNTLARDFVTKLYGRASYHGFTAEQVVGGWLLSPDVWKDEPMIKIKSEPLRQMLGIDGSYARLSQLYDGNTYRLEQIWKDAQSQGANSALAKSVLEVDEKVGLVLMLTNGTLIHTVADDPTLHKAPPSRVSAEILYNRLPVAKILFMLNLTLGFLSFFFMVYRSTAVRPRLVRPAGTFFRLMLFLSLAFCLFGYALRWYVGGRVPLGNGYETMLFLSLVILALSALMCRRFPYTLVFGFLLSGFTLLVAYLGQMNPQITVLMPVLSSPLLSVHVSVIMVSYALLSFIMLNGLLALWLMRRRPDVVGQLTVLSRLLLYPALFFMAAGIFLGAVWANVSWGSYWSWDPKEVWALITFLIYGAAFHKQGLPLFGNPRFFHAYMVVAFLSILMTYFGVNYLLGGMHSYAG